MYNVSGRVFLSTPSARRATRDPDGHPGRGEISIHALREEGDKRNLRRRAGLSISIHALREEGDGRRTLVHTIHKSFLSTPSARRATCRLRQRQDWETNFYPRPPRGGRQAVSPPSATMLQNFYPRPPRGGRLPWIRLKVSHFLISIHALREEGDQSTPRRGAGSQNFYPRPPRGGRLVLRDTFDYDISISIHALREEGDPPFRALPTRCRAISIHALREEGDCATISSAERQQTFLSTPSARRATKEG